jgi:hypothetical protein
MIIITLLIDLEIESYIGIQQTQTPGLPKYPQYKLHISGSAAAITIPLVAHLQQA